MAFTDRLITLFKRAAVAVLFHKTDRENLLHAQMLNDGWREVVIVRPNDEHEQIAILPNVFEWLARNNADVEESVRNGGKCARFYINTVAAAVSKSPTGVDLTGRFDVPSLRTVYYSGRNKYALKFSYNLKQAAELLGYECSTRFQYSQTVQRLQAWALGVR